jgi:hypothetical protein
MFSTIVISPGDGDLQKSGCHATAPQLAMKCMWAAEECWVPGLEVKARLGSLTKLVSGQCRIRINGCSVSIVAK